MSILQGELRGRLVPLRPARVVAAWGLLASALVGAQAAVPPDISITNISVLPAHQIEVQVRATDADGVVVRVELLAEAFEVVRGFTSVTQSLTAPFTLRWTAPLGGGYNFQAVAMDDSGLSATSGVWQVCIKEPLQGRLVEPREGALFSSGRPVPLMFELDSAEEKPEGVHYEVSSSPASFSSKLSHLPHTWPFGPIPLQASIASPPSSALVA